MTEDFDIIIIGAGVVGGIIAAKLAARAKILVLEAGEEGPPRVELVGAYAIAPKKTMGAPYQGRDGDRYARSPDDIRDYYVQSGPDFFRATYQRRYGGSTWHWRGNVPRMIPSDFQMKSQFGVGVDWPISYDDLEPWYGLAEAELGVSGDHEEWAGYLGARRSSPYPMSRIWPCYGDTVVKPLLDGTVIQDREVIVMSTPQARNSQPYDGRPPCAGNSTCDPICPIGAKYDATTHLDKARLGGVEIRPQSVATQLHVGDDERVSGVTYMTWDGAKHQVRGRVVVVATHAIEAPKLLLMSRTERFAKGVANSSDQVGRNLMDHLQGQGAAILPMPLYPFRGPPTTSGIDAFRDGSFRRASAAFRMSIGNDGWGLVRGPYATVLDLVRKEKLFGVKLRKRIQDVLTRQFRLSYSTETLPDPENRVTLAAEVDELGIPRPNLVFRLSDYNRQGFAMGRGVIRTLFQKLGASEITIPEGNTFSAANHIMGTCRMGKDARTSVVDVDCRAHDHRNLFIVGGSAFPTCGTANPTLTVAALALRSIEPIVQELTS